MPERGSVEPLVFKVTKPLSRCDDKSSVSFSCFQGLARCRSRGSVEPLVFKVAGYPSCC